MRRFISGAVALLVVLSSFSVASSAEAGPAPDLHRAAPARAVKTDAWGPLRLGMNHRQAWRTGMVSHAYGRCAAGYQMAKAYRERGFVVWGDFRPKPFKVEEIVINGTKDRTPKGAGVGTTLRQLRELYPGLTPLTQSTALDDQPGRDKKDLWIVSLKKRSGTLNFQFAYGTRPKPGAKVERMLISREQEVYWGC